MDVGTLHQKSAVSELRGESWANVVHDAGVGGAGRAASAWRGEATCALLLECLRRGRHCMLVNRPGPVVMVMVIHGMEAAVGAACHKGEYVLVS